MKTFYLLALPVIALVASVVACSDDKPSLARVVITETSEPTNTSLTYIEFTDDNVEGELNIDGDAAKGIFLGEGLSYVLDTNRSFLNKPGVSASNQVDPIYERTWMMAVQGDCVSTSTVDNQPNEIVINAVHDGDCSVTFSVNQVAGKVVMPVHVVDQGKVPPSVYPPGQAPGTVSSGDDGGVEASTGDGGTEAGH